MSVLVLVGRILFSALFIGAGIGHLRNAPVMTEYARFKRLPAPRAGVIGSGLLILGGGLMVLLGVWADLGAVLLILFLLPAALIFHDFWREKDPQTAQNQQAHFMKNIALAGAALIIFAVFAHLGDDLGLTLTGPLFRID
jgi:putative oxidoreductase